MLFQSWLSELYARLNIRSARHRPGEQRRRSSSPLTKVEPLELRVLPSASPIGNEFRVNTTTTGQQLTNSVGSGGAVAMAADGDFVVTWTSEGQDGDGAGVYARLFNSNGIPKGSEIHVNTTTQSNQLYSTAAMDADGDFVVTWSSRDQDGSGYGVYARQYNAAGGALGDEFRVNTFTTHDQRFSTVAMDDDGDFVVTWTSYYQDGPDTSIYAKRYNAAGVAQGDEFRANSTTADYQMYSAVAMDADGDFVVTWTSFNQDGERGGIYGQRYDATGVPQGGEFHASTYTIDNQWYTSVSMDDGGDFVVTWMSTGQDGSEWGVFAQRFDASGSPLGNEFQVNTYTASYQGYATVASAANGDFVISWMSQGQDGSAGGIYARQYNAAGVAQGNEFLVNTTTANEQSFPTVAMDAAGDFVVVWTTQGATDADVNAQRYSTSSVDTEDFGDAPSPYPTSTAENGARHTPTGPTLGANRDGESDGTHSTNANADDTTSSPNDEDGVTFGTLRAGDLGTILTVNVQGAPFGARLDAWIDFNGDGSWGGLNEQIAHSIFVADGNNTIVVDVPTWAVAGQSFARFRLSTAGSLGIVGAATDGEVEDYLITIMPPVAASGEFSSEHVVGSGNAFDDVRNITVADLDQDGDLDLITGARDGGPNVQWHENDGQGSFTSHTIANSAAGIHDLVVTDVDGDGDWDILGAQRYGSQVIWYKNDGSQNFTVHDIGAASSSNGVAGADFDGDGDVDVASASSGDGTIAWFENNGDVEAGFSRHVLTTGAAGGIGIHVADIDGDGDVDIVAAASYVDTILWFENTGDGNFTTHTVASGIDSPFSVFATDVNGDGNMDVVAALQLEHYIVWYENDGSETFTRHNIAPANNAFNVTAADIDGDGDMDVLGNSQLDHQVLWHENDGTGNFTIHLVANIAGGPLAVVAADINGDGRLDIATVANTSNKVVWYQNLAQQSFDFGDAPDTGSGTGVGNYQTLLANGGPSHIITTTQTTLFLGSSVDGDIDAVPNNYANGDDITMSPDDETGLIEPSQDLVLTIGTDPVVRVRATNMTGSPATLYGWIDYNQDGIFDNATERTSTSVPVATNNGTFILTFPTIPLNGSAGTTYARFRLSTDSAAANSTGAAFDGEVEDYGATITSVSGGTVDSTKSKKIASGTNGGSTLNDGDFFGTSIAAIGDLDNDGVTDLAVGANGDSTGGSFRGAVYIQFMNANGTVKSGVKLASGLNGTPILADFDNFGQSVTSLGDLDGDGVVDLAVGAIGDSTNGSRTGAVHVLMMNVDGTVKRSTKITKGLNGGPALANVDSFGFAVSSIGDLDGDGVTDLAVGASYDRLNSVNGGAVYVLFLNPDGTAKGYTKIASGTNGGPTLSDSDQFGVSVVPLGDLDGDGVTDLGVGAQLDDSTVGDGGAVHILFLNIDGRVKSQVKLSGGVNGAPSLSSGDLFGSSLTSLGDLDGDGITDLAVGSYRDDTEGDDRGSVYVLLMNADGTVRSNLELASGTNGAPSLSDADNFGVAIASLGDLDGDGRTDLAVAARLDDTNGANRGAVHILFLKAAPTSVNLSVSTASATESGASIITVTATASGPVTGDQTLNLGVTGSGIDVSDYLLSNSVITILNGQTTGSVTFTVIDDQLVEANEVAILTISNPSAGIVLGATVDRTVTIIDNDFATVSISSIADGLEPGTNGRFRVTQSAASSTDTVVTYVFTGNSTPGVDYSTPSGTVTIPAGSTTADIDVSVLNDSVGEYTETVTATLTGFGAHDADIRVLTNGDLDPSFGSGGIDAEQFPNATSQATEALVQTDGKIVITGIAVAGGVNHFALTRLNVNGTLDTTFGTQGFVTTTFAGDHARGMASTLQSDGKIVVVGQVVLGNNETVFGTARYNSDGTLDISFGSGGLVTTGLPGTTNDLATGVAIQSDGKIVVGGSFLVGGFGTADFGVIRYLADGSLDTTFGSGGIVRTDFGAHDGGNTLLLQSDGKIVVGGLTSTGSPQFGLARYNTDGSRDTSFSDDGFVATLFSGGNSQTISGLAQQPDGKLLAVGAIDFSYFGRNSVALARYNSDGSLDTTFNSVGYTTFGVAEGHAQGKNVAVMADGRILVGGWADGDVTGPDFLLVQFNSTGTLDSTFGTNGFVRTFITADDDNALGMAVQPDGRVVLAGYIGGENTGTFGAVRYSQSATINIVDNDFDLVVTTADDELDAVITPEDLSLREAMYLANQRPGANIISFVTSGVFSTAQTITLTLGQLAFTDGSGITTINGPGADVLAVSGNDLTRVFHVLPGVTAAVDAITVRNGFVSDTAVYAGGGGFRVEGSLQLSNSHVINNHVLHDGAGILVLFGQATITNSLLANNSGSMGLFNEGGLVTIRGTTISGNNGGLFQAATGQAMLIDSSTLSGNSGWGVFNDRRDNVLIFNSTISQNAGTGVFNKEGVTTIRHSTITANQEDAHAAGIYNQSGGRVILSDTIVAGNQTASSSGDINGIVTSEGFNLIGFITDASGLINGVNGDQVGTYASPIDPVLGPLTDNGGPTKTHALLAGSPASNSGNPNFVPPPDYDQRGAGFVRVLGGRIDIGAFEAYLGTLQATVDGSGNLTVTDIGPSGRDNDLTISVAGDSLVITDAHEQFVSAPAGGSLSNGSKTLTIPFSAFAGTITFEAAAGADALTISLAGGNIARAIDFHGGDPSAAPGDRLTLTGGGEFATASYVFANTSDGSVSVTGNGLITYTGLEPITDNLNVVDRLFTFNGGSETISLTDAAGASNTIDSTLSESVTFTNPSGSLTINAGTGDDTVTVESIDAAFAAGLTINGDAGSDVVNLNADLTFAAHRNLNIDLTDDADPGDADQINVGANANLLLAGTGSATLKSSRNITLQGGSSIVTVDGNIDLAANSSGATTGNFIGINVNGATLNSGAGTLNLSGHGGLSAADSNRGVVVQNGGSVTSTGGHVVVVGVGGGSAASNFNFGVQVESGGQISSGGAGNLSIEGTAGQMSGAGNVGVLIFGVGSSITSGGGNVSVTGQGGGTGAGFGNWGVDVQGGALISAGGMGTVTVHGTGGASSGDGNHGVVLFDNHALITSSGGAVTITGYGGGIGTSSGNRGVWVGLDSQITAGNSGTVSVTGYGAASSGSGNFGVILLEHGVIDSHDGDVTVEGFGGGAGSSQFNFGVDLEATGKISAGGLGNVTVKGTGGSTAGDRNVGVRVYGGDAVITSSGGSVDVIGHGGGTGTSPADYGVLVQNYGQVTAGGTGMVTVDGYGAVTTGNINHGIYVLEHGTITSAGGDVAVHGYGGGVGSSEASRGIQIENYGLITASGEGKVSIDGTGGAGSGNANHGILLTNHGAVTSNDGNIAVSGDGGGTGGSNFSFGVEVHDASQISAGGDGSVTIDGTASSATGNAQHGVVIIGTGSSVTSNNGDVEIIGHGGGSGTSDSSWGIDVENSALVKAGGVGEVVLEGFGGSGTGNFNVGVIVAGGIVTSDGGGVNVTGQGGGSGSSRSNHGVLVEFQGQITAGGLGTVHVDGAGGGSSGAQNIGVYVTGVNSVIKSHGGDVEVLGTGGGSGSSFINHGILVIDGGAITASGAGDVTVHGEAGDGTGVNNTGVFVEGINSIITSGGGHVSVTGIGGNLGLGNYNFGVYAHAGGVISAGSQGNVMVEGTGGTSSGDGQIGVVVFSSGSSITSSGGNVTVIGHGGGTGASSFNSGVNVAYGGTVTAGGSGSVDISGTGGATSGSSNHGVLVNYDNPTITSNGGDVQITGISGSGTSSIAIEISNTGRITTATHGGQIRFIGDSMNFDSTAVIDSGNATTYLRQFTDGVAINLGSTVDTTPDTLELSDAELDRITAAGIQVGDADSNLIQITTPISPLNYNVLGLGNNSAFTSTGGFVSDITSATYYERVSVNGSMSIHANATLTITPLGGFVPAVGDSFTLIENVSDGSTTGNFSGKPQATVIQLGGINKQITYVGGAGANDVMLIPADNPPVAEDDAFSTNEDVALILTQSDLKGNDTDIDHTNAQLSVSAVSNAVNGTVVLNGNGTITFTPALNFYGTASFDYTVSDGELTDIGHVTITVNPVNDAPVAVNDSATTNEDTPLTLTQANLKGNDTDVDNTDTQLTVTAVSNPTNGTVVLNGNGTITFTPAVNFNGTAGFDYTVSDGSLTSTGHVTVTVNAVNDAPVASSQSITTNEDTAKTGAVVATDVDGNSLTYSMVANPTHGTLVLNSNGTFTYTPAANYNGPDSFTFHANDGTVNSNTATVSITVNAINDAPTISAQTFTLAENSANGMTVGTVVASDVDAGDTRVFTITGGNSLGAFAISAAGAISVADTTKLDFETTPTFSLTVTVTDAGGLPASATITINLTDVVEAVTPVLTGYQLQKGQIQRSFIRYIDLTFNSAAGLDALISSGRIKLSRQDLLTTQVGGVNQLSPTSTAVSLAGSVSHASGSNQVKFDFGANGVGGSANSIAGDGYYKLELDLNSDGVFETKFNFYRLLGDRIGDRSVDQADVNDIQGQIGQPYNPAYDLNGDGAVNNADLVAVVRSKGRKISSTLIVAPNF